MNLSMKMSLAAFLRFPLLAVVAAASLAQSNPAQDQSAQNPPARAGRISYLEGRVSFQPAGQEQWSEATLNFTVTTGDRIYTDSGARAEIEVGPYTVRLDGNTDLTITNLNDQVLQLALEQGTLQVSVYELRSGNTVEIDTPNGALTVLEPGTFRADVDPTGAFTTVTVNSGSLEVTGGGVSQRVEAGQAVKLEGTQPISVVSIPPPSPDSFDDWCQTRDDRLSASASAKHVSRDTPGYEDLDAYGTWEDVADYGPVWYPAGLAVGWVPYRFGHWAWIEPWGWTWVDDAVWGFCPFHYGRWVLIAGVWGWLPGPYVVLPYFTPAMVAFVGGPGISIGVAVGGVGLAAWFPLGPAEPFFPWYHWTGAYLQEVNITNIRNVTNITNIINVTNINNVHYAYRTVAATAVPASVLQRGEHVAPHIVKLRPEQLEHAQIVAHPLIRPTVRAALPGRPVAPPPVRRPSFTAANRSPAANARHPIERVPERTPPPMETRSRTLEPTPRTPERVPHSAPRPIAPHVITKLPPPPPHIPFEVQRPALMEHPGRPLEPQQLDNLRSGRPTGPMLDREFPPHIEPVPRPSPVAPPVARPRRPGGGI